MDRKTMITVGVTAIVVLIFADKLRALPVVKSIPTL